MKRALLVIDVQNEYFTGKYPVSYPKNSFDNILDAIDAAHNNDIPVILVKHISSDPEAQAFREGSPECEIHQEVLSRKYNYLIKKHFPGSFTGTDLETVLKKDNIDTVVICGYMTQMCCDTTSRQAFHMGYRVEFLSDGTGTLSLSNYAGSISGEELHRAVLITQTTFSRVISTEAWIKSI
jgi:nicotinamidase-related amidase